MGIAQPVLIGAEVFGGFLNDGWPRGLRQIQTPQRSDHIGDLVTPQVVQLLFGVFLALVTARATTWVDGELFLPADWFSEAFAVPGNRLGCPARAATAGALFGRA